MNHAVVRGQPGAYEWQMAFFGDPQANRKAMQPVAVYLRNTTENVRDRELKYQNPATPIGNRRPCSIRKDDGIDRK